MRRFVILRHKLPPDSPRDSHFDLMLEQNGVLRTWACDSLPAHGQTVDAQQLTDHRLAYLEYEGAVSGDRGSVKRVAAGEYEWIAETADELCVRIRGETMCGLLKIERQAGESQRWRVSLTAG